MASCHKPRMGERPPEPVQAIWQTSHGFVKRVVNDFMTYEHTFREIYFEINS